MKDSVLKNILVNTRALFRRNISKEINGLKKRVLELESRLAQMEQNSDIVARNSFCYLTTLQYFAQNNAGSAFYAAEIDYLKKLGHFCNFPYPSESSSFQNEAGFDSEAGLPFVVHDGKKMYFPSTYTVEDAIRQYNHLVRVEKILEKEDGTPAPHCYQSERVRLCGDDVLFDIGSAEGLFALHHVDKVKHIVLVECDSLWHDCLRRTFAPYCDKVDLVAKALGVEDGGDCISLPSLLATRASDNVFVKMDIEGGEISALLASEHYLKSCHGKVKLSVAAYHKQNDADMLEEVFKRMGFYSEFSKGYMLFNDYDMPLPPYFRHGIIRAVNIGQ